VNRRTPRHRARLALIALLALTAAPVHAGDGCDVPTASWQPRSAVEALAQRNGWQIDHLKIDDGCYEIKGRDADGFRIKVKLDPATLDVVKMKREREKRRGLTHEAADRETQNPQPSGENP
jgi:hypothetical protein